MNNNLFILIVFWGVWIIIPVIFDGVLTFIYMLTILIRDPGARNGKYQHNLDVSTLPMVSIIIPTYNEQDNISQCLSFLKIQNYPHEKMEIIVVDNGSTDRTSEIVKQEMQAIWLENHPGQNNQILASAVGKVNLYGTTYNTRGFNGQLRLLVSEEKGKANALNSGIKKSSGEIVMNIDSRSFLAPDAVYNMVAKFIEHPQYGAAMGAVEIDWNMVYERSFDGQLVVDEFGYYKTRELSHKENFLAKCQFLEYLVSFHIGRHFMDITDATYTLSGAFSAFRRDVLIKSHLYRGRTVTEDTDLTLDLRDQNARIGFVADAKAYLKPVLSFERFYGQRIRWHRGQIEVIGLHLDTYGNMKKKFWQGFWQNLLLLIDHTFSFPRNIWIFLLPLFFLFGYSMKLIFIAILLMYLLYIFIDFLNAWFCYRVVDGITRAKIKDTIQYCLVMPFFRLVTFYFRFSAYLDVLKEPQSWSTPINPVRSAKNYRDNLQNGYEKSVGAGGKVWQFISGQKPNTTLRYEEKIVEQDNYGMGEAEVKIDPQGKDEKIIYTQEKTDGIHDKLY